VFCELEGEREGGMEGGGGGGGGDEAEAGEVVLERMEGRWRTAHAAAVARMIAARCIGIALPRRGGGVVSHAPFPLSLSLACYETWAHDIGALAHLSRAPRSRGGGGLRFCIVMRTGFISFY
jgi:hypothetical protein